MKSTSRWGVLVVLLVTRAAGADDWEALVHEARIDIKARSHPKGRELWVEADLDATALDVQEILRDHGSFWRWMPYVKESRIISSDEGGRVTYTRTTPPVVSSRDYVCRAVDEQLVAPDGTGEFRQSWTIVEGALPERRGIVRMHHNEGFWHVTTREGGGSHVVYRFSMNAGGSVPGFLANLGETGAVRELLQSLEKRAPARAADRERASTKP